MRREKKAMNSKEAKQNKQPCSGASSSLLQCLKELSQGPVVRPLLALVSTYSQRDGAHEKVPPSGSQSCRISALLMSRSGTL